MPFTAPGTGHNPSSGAVIPSAWGDSVNDAAAYLGANKPRARVFNSAAQSLTSGTLTALTFDSERYDVGDCHSTVSNTRLTVPTGEGGLYHIFGSVRFSLNATGARSIYIQINGTTRVAQVELDACSSSVTNLVIATDYGLIAGDYVELFAWQTSGGALNVDSIGNHSPEFGFRWVAT